MGFNEAQAKTIYDFGMRYNSEEKFRNSIQGLYDNEPAQLSILQIYALEEFLRYGAKGIYNKFLETKGEYTEEQAINLFDGFIQLLNNDANFKQYKTEQLKSSPETLSAMEKFAFVLISMSKSEREKADELAYDPLNPILFSYDKQIRETLENLFFGEFIHQMLDLPAMKSVKDRQKENGRIANIDKPLIIEKIQGVIATQESMSQFEQAINNRYAKVKMDLLLGKGKDAFAQYLKFNTNISANEILGLRRTQEAAFVEDLYADIMNMIGMKKNPGSETQKR